LPPTRVSQARQGGEGMEVKLNCQRVRTQATLERLVTALRGSFTDDDRAFLLSFEAGDPDWSLFPIAALDELPAPQFKLMNIRKFREASPERHKAALNALEKSLI